MKIPKTRNILGRRWQVKYKWNLMDENRHKCDGLCEYKTRTIWIDRAMSLEDKQQTYLHEEFHAVLHELCFNQLDVSGDAQEVVCEGLSRWVLDTYDLRPRKIKK